MSTPPERICLIGATGLIGLTVLERAAGGDDRRIVAVARRAVPLPSPVSAELLIGDTREWPGLISSAGADVIACAIGTTRAKAGSPEAFRAVDRDLVIGCAKAARAAGVERMIVVSSVGASAASRNLYLRTKGEMEERLAQLQFARLDVLRPAQLIGRRAERRPLERVAQVLMRPADLVLQGPLRRYRSIFAVHVADAILALAGEHRSGHFVHEHDGILRAAGGK